MRAESAVSLYDSVAFSPFLSLLQCRIGFLVGLVISVSREEICFRYFVAMPIPNLVPSSDFCGATVDLDACGQGCGEHTDSVLGG